MINVSQQWAASIGSVNRWRVLAKWSRDGKTWHDMHPVTCSVDEDATQQVRWKTTLTAPADQADGLDVYGCRIKIFVALVYDKNWVEQIQLGDYTVRSISRDVNPYGGDGLIKISAVSWEQQAIDSRFPEPVQVSSAAEIALTELLADVVPDFEQVWDKRIQNRTIRSGLCERDRWAYINGGGASEVSIAKTLGADIYPDHVGAFQIRLAPQLTDQPAWTIRAGHGGAQLSATEQVDRAKIRNVAVVAHEPEKDDTPSLGHVQARDENKWSPTYTNRAVKDGGFGIVPIFYTSNMFTSRTQMYDAANSLLARHTGTKRELEFGTLFDPAKRAGDVGLVETISGHETVILDSVSCDLINATMSCKVRAADTTTSDNITE